MYKSENVYTVYFKDGTKFQSKGHADKYTEKSTVHKEFEWTAFHIHKELRVLGKTMADVSAVTYKLKFNDPIQ